MNPVDWLKEIGQAERLMNPPAWAGALRKSWAVQE